ncbi:MAG TPA: S26 family signal peptidase [Allosphingosinicella sp.]|jgi:conjugative transfer signal peptidase TraF
MPLVRWGEELRRDRIARRRGRFRLFGTAAAAVAATAAVATMLWPPRPWLVWNASESAPIGLYAVSPAGEVRTGDTVIAWPPAPARALAAERGYLPINVPLVKRVAAARGDRVCAAGEALWVNGRLELLRRDTDGAGRPLPWWTGCLDLKDGQYLLLIPGSAASFDGRYFGLTERRELVGIARLLWAR